MITSFITRIEQERQDLFFAFARAGKSDAIILRQMPFTFNGFGTSLYGARDFQPDGSYTTTEWLVGFYFPVWPLKDAS